MSYRSGTSYTMLMDQQLDHEVFLVRLKKKLIHCEQLLVEFFPIQPELPEALTKDFSTDQKFLLEISQVVTTSCCFENLAGRNPGKISHARWLTTSNRILRLYVAESNPSSKFITLMTHIVKV